jgi:hypothetical protein
MSYLSPDPEAMSILEVIALRRRRRELTELWLADRLKLYASDTPKKCISCGKSSVEKVGIAEGVLCVKCFERDWDVSPKGMNHPGQGNRRPLTPSSQMRYNGDRSPDDS